jgi:hypothetical protein
LKRTDSQALCASVVVVAGGGTGIQVGLVVLLVTTGFLRLIAQGSLKGAARMPIGT